MDPRYTDVPPPPPRLSPLPLVRDAADNTPLLPALGLPPTPTSVTAAAGGVHPTQAPPPPPVDIPSALYDIKKLKEADCQVSKGKVYNSKGHQICGVLNQHDRPCHRIGKCPFHFYSRPVAQDNVCNGTVDETGTCYDMAQTPPKKMQYKHGWTKKEHFLFLDALRRFGKGAWKQIALVVASRTPTQVQSHAQKYFLRQKQPNKNKRSIHDFTLESPEMAEIEKEMQMEQAQSLSHHPHQHPPPTQQPQIFDDFHFPSFTSTHHQNEVPRIATPMQSAPMVSPPTFNNGFRTTNVKHSPAVVPVPLPLAYPAHNPPALSINPVANNASRSPMPAVAQWPFPPEKREPLHTTLFDTTPPGPVTRAPTTLADNIPLFYANQAAAYSAAYPSSCTSAGGSSSTCGFPVNVSAPIAVSVSTTAQSYEEQPSTNVLMGAGDNVVDMLGSLKASGGIKKPIHQSQKMRKRHAPLSHGLMGDGPPFVDNAAALPAAFLTTVDLPTEDASQQPPARSLGALLSVSAKQ